MIASVVFIAAFITATLFTFLKTKKEGVAIWGNSAKRLMWNTALPMLAGGFIIWRMIQLNEYQLVAPACLIFYGLALVNGSKYTIGEVRYLGYAEDPAWHHKLMALSSRFIMLGHRIRNISYHLWPINVVEIRKGNKRSSNWHDELKSKC